MDTRVKSLHKKWKSGCLMKKNEVWTLLKGVRAEAVKDKNIGLIDDNLIKDVARLEKLWEGMNQDGKM